MQARKSVALVFAAQLLLGVGSFNLDHTSYARFSVPAFLLSFFGAPVAYFIVLRRADFKASSPMAHLLAAAISAVALSLVGMIPVAIIGWIFFPR